MTEILDSMNIEKATFKTGDSFHRDPKTNVATLSTYGLMVQQGEHTTIVTFRKPLVVQINKLLKSYKPQSI